MPKPIPVPDELSKPFWDACNERRLIVQNCTACDRMQYPPQAMCAGCRSADHLAWRERAVGEDGMDVQVDAGHGWLCCHTHGGGSSGKRPIGPVELEGFTTS